MKENRKISTSSNADENKGNPQDIKTMFTCILSKLEGLKKQNEGFREEARKDIADLKEETKNFYKSQKKSATL